MKISLAIAAAIVSSLISLPAYSQQVLQDGIVEKLVKLAEETKKNTEALINKVDALQIRVDALPKRAGITVDIDGAACIDSSCIGDAVAKCASFGYPKGMPTKVVAVNTATAALYGFVCMD